MAKNQNDFYGIDLSQPIKHYGVEGMKWGQNLFGKEEDPKKLTKLAAEEQLMDATNKKNEADKKVTQAQHYLETVNKTMSQYGSYDNAPTYVKKMYNEAKERLYDAKKVQTDAGAEVMKAELLLADVNREIKAQEDAASEKKEMVDAKKAQSESKVHADEIKAKQEADSEKQEMLDAKKAQSAANRTQDPEKQKLAEECTNDVENRLSESNKGGPLKQLFSNIFNTIIKPVVETVKKVAKKVSRFFSSLFNKPMQATVDASFKKGTSKADAADAKNDEKKKKLAHSAENQNGEEYLEHWGLLGMKWGRRRFRNYDNTLTPEGKARYYKRYGKRLDEYTTEELRAAIDRIQTERQYIRVFNEQVHDEEMVDMAYNKAKRENLRDRLNIFDQIAKSASTTANAVAGVISAVSGKGSKSSGEQKKPDSEYDSRKKAAEAKLAETKLREEELALRDKLDEYRRKQVAATP